MKTKVILFLLIPITMLASKPAAPAKPKLKIDIPLGAAIAKHYQPVDNSPSIEKVNALLSAGTAFKTKRPQLKNLIDTYEPQKRRALLVRMFDKGSEMPIALYIAKEHNGEKAIPDIIAYLATDKALEEIRTNKKIIEEMEALYQQSGVGKVGSDLSQSYKDFEESASDKAKAGLQNAMQSIKTFGELLDQL